MIQWVAAALALALVQTLPPPPAGFSPIETDSPKKEKLGERRAKRLAKFAAQDIETLKGKTVLVGDSITAGFPVERLLGDGAVNRGIGGDTIGAIRHRGVLDRLQTTVYNLEPTRIILMIGTNDLLWSRGTPLKTKILQYQYLVWRIRRDLPDVELWCISVLPAKGTYADKNTDIAEFNAAVAAEVVRYGANWLDVTATFALPDGTLNPDLARDNVHINRKGYEALTARYEESIFAD